MKFNSRDTAFAVLAVAFGLALGLVLRLPARPDVNNMMSLIGALVSGPLALAAGLIILQRQFETADERHIRTVRDLLETLRSFGEDLQKPSAALDPTTHVTNALLIFKAIKAVTGELRATSSAMAALAQIFDGTPLEARLTHLSTPGLGIATVDLNARGTETIEIAEAGLSAFSK